MEDLLKTIEEKATAAAAEHEAYTAAREEEYASQADLLALIVERVRPALRALASRIVSRYRSWWVDSACTDSLEEYYDWRGVRLAGDGVEEDHPRANRGAYEGDRLVLDTECRWHRLTYTGSWSRWQGESDHWGAEDEILDPAQVVREYDLGEIVQALSELLDGQLGGRKGEATKAALGRAGRLRALRDLL